MAGNMEGPITQELSLDHDHDRDEEPEAGGSAKAVIAVIVAIVVLSLAKDILLPLAIAALLAAVFTPIANRLESWVGRLLSSALIVIAVVSSLVAVGYFLTVQLTSVAVEMTNYSDNIAAKLSKIATSTPEWLQRIESGVKDVQQQVQNASPRLPKARPPTIVQAQVVAPTASDVLKPALPILGGIAEGSLIIVLFFFLLYGRRDLRDRLIRLAARARISVAAEAIETACYTVGHYLLLFTLTNLGYGVAIGIVVWLFGLPNPAFWGGLAFLLRFIPYVGVLISALLPTLVAFAVFPGWSKSLEVAAAFIILDQVAAQFIEPFIIGHGIGLSPLALLVSAMFWAWLWGLPGLLMATPLTACLKVAGDFIPGLGVLSILLGADRKLEDYHDYYRTLLELDLPAARTLAIRYSDENGLEQTFNDVLIPAVILSGEERAESHISQENEQFIIETTSDLVSELGNRFTKPRSAPHLRILGICAPGDVHSLGLLILLELLRHEGAAATLMDPTKTPDEIRHFASRFQPDMVCLSCTMTEGMPAAVELTRGLKKDSPRLTIIGGGRAALADPSELIQAGCAQICGSRSEARRAIRRYVMRRLRSRTGLPDSSRPMTVKENAAMKEPDPTPAANGAPAA
jgi:predicted PurR-regulated permease PerM/methanogenic corrinoid protein MtbC1